MAVDVFDFTALQKRGLIKKHAEAPASDVLDLRPVSDTNSTSGPAQPDNTNAFDFLSSFAQASASPSNEPSAGVAPSARGDDISLKLDTITNKLDDAMFKIELLSSKIAQLESRLR